MGCVNELKIQNMDQWEGIRLAYATLAVPWYMLKKEKEKREFCSCLKRTGSVSPLTGRLWLRVHPACLSLDHSQLYTLPNNLIWVFKSFV